jgi:tRNA-uridine 2-sulfurtransferase
MSGRKRIVAAMSGGVDSSVAALLLQEAGYDVVGLFLKNGVKAPEPGQGSRPGRQGCCSIDDAADARRVADALRIPFYALDYGREFSRIIEYFVDEYNSGKTPSPCVLCNTWLKFGTLVEFAKKLGAEAVATGHYARVDVLEGDGPRYALRRAADRAKDQTYFLSGLTQEQLAWCRFPVGGLTKPEVREIARRADLRVAEKPESMEICFVPTGDYRRVLEERAPGSLREGDIVDEDGNALGRHGGFQGFTIGQRKGLKLAMAEPTYVTGLDPGQNRVIVGPREALAREELIAEKVVWGSRVAPAVGDKIPCAVQIRHRHTPVPATAEVEADGRVRVRFDRPVDAIAAGQAVALYDGEYVLAGGFIA